MSRLGTERDYFFSENESTAAPRVILNLPKLEHWVENPFDTK